MRKLIDLIKLYYIAGRNFYLMLLLLNICNILKRHGYRIVTISYRFYNGDGDGKFNNSLFINSIINKTFNTKGYINIKTSLPDNDTFGFNEEDDQFHPFDVINGDKDNVHASVFIMIFLLVPNIVILFFGLIITLVICFIEKRYYRHSYRYTIAINLTKIHKIAIVGKNFLEVLQCNDEITREMAYEMIESNKSIIQIYN